ncbi:MAG: hypothetical protein GVY12_14245 [Bacteroidetes bacterium]|nr:hypothetical protein [Bacteroidota bacterium]
MRPFDGRASMAAYAEGLDAPCPGCGSSDTKRRLGGTMISVGSPTLQRPPQGGCTPGGGCC